jgi:hypothetical protein
VRYKEEPFSYREAARRVSETLKNDTKNQEPGPKARDASLRPKELLRQPRILLGAVAVVIFIGAFVAWLVVHNNSHRSSTPSAEPVAPVGLSERGLRTLAAAVGQPIYWAGPKAGYLYELTRTKEGNVLIRYLPPGAKVGTPKPELTVATYPYPHALRALRNVARSRKHRLPGGGLALIDTRSPQNVHVAYPGVNYQIDVYDSSAARSQQIALSGDVRPVFRR